MKWNVWILRVLSCFLPLSQQPHTIWLLACVIQFFIHPYVHESEHSGIEPLVVDVLDCYWIRERVKPRKGIASGQVIQRGYVWWNCDGGCGLWRRVCCLFRCTLLLLGWASFFSIVIVAPSDMAVSLSKYWLRVWGHTCCQPNRVRL